VRGTNGGRNLESAFLHVTSAGNIDTPGDTDGRTDSEFTAAALLPESELGVPPLTNVLVVENRTKFTAQRPFRPDCLSSTSKRGGNISAIGDQVFSLTDARESATRVTAGFRSGTSMAAPQVAGLAAYLLSLRRTLSVAELKSLLLATTRPVPGCDGAPVIDAYAAVLAADHGTERTVRRALLDVTNTNGDPQGDGVFDVHDLGVILGELESAPGDIDYSRYDLNGDGRTGGTERARVDLDVDDPPAYTPITRTLASLGPVEFDENAVTDLQVLCFYAYSSLYTGSTQDRDALLGTQCAPCPAGQQLGRAIDQCQSTTTTSPAGSTTTVTATTDVPPTTTICMCPPGFQCCAGTFCCF
jgi:hypothetical protein